MSGLGTLYWRKFGDKYEGHFLNDLCHGYGSYDWGNGDKFIGQFEYN